MAQAFDAIVQLARNDQPVSIDTDWFSLTEARLQMAWYSDPHPDMAVAVILTPAGPQLAGRHGVGMLSVGGADDERIARVWEWYAEAAHEAGHQPDRRHWKVVIPIHIAESRAQAISDVRDGYIRRAYVGDARDPSRAGGLFGNQAPTIEEAIDLGQVIVGDPHDAIQQIEALHDRAGGIGGLLSMAHEWTSTDATQRSYELLMRYAAPRFQGQLNRLEASRDFVEDRQMDIFGAGFKAMAKAFADSGKDMPEDIKRGLAAANAAAAKTRQPEVVD